MKLIISISVIILFVTNAFSQTFENVDAIKFKQLSDAGDGIILDVRTSDEYSRGHIANSTLIDLSDKNFNTKINLMQKSKPIYVYCLSGSRSAYAAKELSKNGFNKVYNLQSGLMGWNRAGYSLVTDGVIAKSNKVSYTYDSINKILKTNKVVLADFSATWCAPCKKMLPIVEKIKGEYKNKVEILNIDIESNSDIAKKFNVLSVPTFIIFKNGKNVWQQSGAISEDDLKKALKTQLK